MGNWLADAQFLTQRKNETGGIIMSLVFRRFVKGDLEILKNWFKDEELQKRLGGMLPLDEWYERVNSIPNQFHYMVLNENVLVGGICIEEYEDKTASISLFVNPQLRNQGYGSRVLSNLSVFLKEYSHFKLAKWVVNFSKAIA